MKQSIRHSNVLRTGYLLGILLFSWGIIAGGVRTTLPHVKNYQTVTPHRLKDSSLISDAATHQAYPDELWYSLTMAEQNYTMHLERNNDLIRENFSATHYPDQGAQVPTMPDLGVHCYYQGHIVGVEDSSASVGLCSGMKGFVLLQDQMYLIGPRADPDAGQHDDRHSSETESSEGLHVVYNYKHLRKKTSSCSRENTPTYDDHRARPSGLVQLSRLEVEAQTKYRAAKPRTVELVLVADHTEYKKYKKTIETRMLEIANHVDKLYRPMGVRVMLVGVDIWSDQDQIEVSTESQLTLNRFLDWRHRALLPRIPHDNAQLITGVDFNGSIVGRARQSSMCKYGSGGVNQDFSTDTLSVATIMAHEMGHNLGLAHDTEKCVCGSSVTKRECIMAAVMGYRNPELFSSCSQQQLSQVLEKVNWACLLDTPSTNRIYGGPVCGNAFLEPGEECDCGTVEECKNTCCIATTCKFAQCAEGECCHNCRLKPTGSVCRPKAGDCDLAEYCTGLSPSCPTDAYTQNGLSCNRGKGYCYNGNCPLQQKHCKRLLGSDLGIVPNGTKCGNNMVCYNEQCQNIINIKAFGTRSCSAKCNNHGVCNHENKCHCDPGWAASFCIVQFPVLPEESGMPMIFRLLVVGALLLMVLVIGIVRCHQSTSGQSAPVLRLSSTRDSSCRGNTLISQPSLVEFSATQPLSPANLSSLPMTDHTLEHSNASGEAEAVLRPVSASSRSAGT